MMDQFDQDFVHFSANKTNPSKFQQRRSQHRRGTLGVSFEDCYAWEISRSSAIFVELN